MRNFVKNHLLVLLIAALASFLAFFWFLFRGQPEEEVLPPTPEEIEKPTSEFLLPAQGEVRVLLSPGISQLFPQSLPVFEIETFSSGGATNFVLAMAADLGFESPPEAQTRPDGTYLIWQEGGNYLSVNQTSGRFTFVGDAKIAAAVSGENAVSTTKRLLSSWNIFSGEAENEILGFVTAGQELEPARSLATADTFAVRLVPKLAGFRVLGSGTADPVIEAKLTREGSLLSLSFKLSQTRQFQAFPTRSLSEAAEEAGRGNAEILRVVDLQGNPVFPTAEDSLASSTITGVEVVFLETPEAQKLIFPFFLFSGRGETKSGISVTVFFVLPAV